MREYDRVSSYARPPIELPVLLDADGQVIDYGRRWDGSPPDETYSVDTHPERFAPLHDVADALVAYLRDTYDVRLLEGPELATDLIHPAREVVRAVRLRPDKPDCAALTIVYTDYPGIIVHAGLLHDFPYPVCGCDACDSTWEGEADEFEQLVLAVVTGRYRERIEPGMRPWVAHTVTYAGGWRGGRQRAKDLPAERVRAARPVLSKVADGWAPWPPAASR